MNIGKRLYDGDNKILSAIMRLPQKLVRQSYDNTELLAYLSRHKTERGTILNANNRIKYLVGFRGDTLDLKIVTGLEWTHLRHIKVWRVPLKIHRGALMNLQEGGHERETLRVSLLAGCT